MPNYIEQLIKSWADDEMTAINLRVDHLEKRLFKSYEPNKFINGEFWTRCESWLKNLGTQADQKILYRLLTKIFYVGPAEFEELFRNAYEGPVARWLSEKEKIDVCVSGAQTALQKAAENTWFCPVTDSFRINSFFHINNLPSNANLRPDWCSLYELADVEKLTSYIKKKKITRLVLLEDFVGGGSQSLKAVDFAVTHSNTIDVLFIPMIICPAGAEKMRQLEIRLNTQRPGSFKFSPVLELPHAAFFTPTSSSFSQTDTTELRNLLSSTYPAVSGEVIDGDPYHMYGFPPKDPTGGLVVMYTNTPNNTLPIIHWRPTSGSWEPVFPRHSRA